MMWAGYTHDVFVYDMKCEHGFVMFFDMELSISVFGWMSIIFIPSVYNFVLASYITTAPHRINDSSSALCCAVLSTFRLCCALCTRNFLPRELHIYRSINSLRLHTFSCWVFSYYFSIRKLFIKYNREWFIYIVVWLNGSGNI